MKDKKIYIDKEKFHLELIKCLKTGRMSEQFGKDVMLISTNLSHKFKYSDYRNKEDCISFGILEVVKYWNKYDPEKSINAFAFITQIAKNGIIKGYTRLQHYKSVDTVYIDIFSLE